MAACGGRPPGTGMMKLIFDLLFRSLTVCHAVLPHNLLWFRRWSRLDHLFAEAPIFVIDIGARGGSVGELGDLARHAECCAFDADREAAEQLGASGQGAFRRYTVLPFFVGGVDGETTFYIYRNPAESSALRPDPRNLRLMRDFQIDREVIVTARTIDTLAGEGILADADLVKIDTQGTEYSILEHGNWFFDHATLFEIEVEFTEIYESQRLFFDIHRLMHEKGYELLYLNRVFVSRPSYPGPSRGQLVFGDALFGLSEERAHLLSPVKKAKYIALLIQYGHVDFAHALFAADPEIQGRYPQFADYFGNWNSLVSRIGRFLVFQFDKLLTLLLLLRGTNRLRHDSDRSYPLR